MKVCLTGGIACGKSLFSRYLNELGIETIDADDIVHSLIPEEERRHLASIVFRDAAARRELEARIHPQVLERLSREIGRVAVIPLLFETGWERNYDLVACLSSSRENQIHRMTEKRGMSATDAEARIAAQMPLAEKAARADYVIVNDGTTEELRSAAVDFVKWLKDKEQQYGR